MQIGTKFSVAIHILLSTQFFKNEKNTSEFLAGTIGTNPVVVRNIIACLKNANLITTKAGIGGISLTKEPSNITLYDIYMSVNDNSKNLFKIHSNSPSACPLGSKIEALLEPKFILVQDELKNALNKINLQNLLDELQTITSF